MHRAVVTITRWCGTAAVARRRPLHLADDEAARQAAGAVRCTTHGESGTEGERTRCEPRAPRTARARWTRRTRRASARRSPPWMGPAASRERKEKIEADCPSAHGGARFIQVSSEAARVLTTRKVRHRSASTSVRSGRSARITGSTSFFRRPSGLEPHEGGADDVSARRRTHRAASGSAPMSSKDLQWARSAADREERLQGRLGASCRRFLRLGASCWALPV